jgi:hypothetical protein
VRVGLKKSLIQWLQIVGTDFLNFVPGLAQRVFCGGPSNAEKKIQNQQIAVDFVTDEQKIKFFYYG